MTDRNLTELKYMAEKDPELSKPRKEAAAWALAEIARLRAQIAAPGDGEIAAMAKRAAEWWEYDPGQLIPQMATALTALQAENEDAFVRGVAHGQKALRQMEGKTFHVIDSPELATLRADLAAAVAAKEKVERDRDCFQRMTRAHWEALCAMRNSINEYIPMPSTDSGPLFSPEDGPIYADIAERVVAEIKESREYALALQQELKDRAAKSDPIVAASKRVLHDIDDLVANSEGVSGLHMNGEVADWQSIMSGGSFGAWLESVEILRAALPEVKEEKPINWASDPDAIVEDDEPQIRRDYA